MLGTAPVRASGKRMTARDRAQKLVDNGQDVYILRWKKANPFGETMFCFDNVELKERFDHNLMATVYDAVPVSGQAINFIPEDEDQIPIAYIPVTEKNKKILAKSLSNAPYLIAGLATFGGVKRSEEAVKALREFAKTLPPEPERKKWVGRDINGKIIGDKAPVTAPIELPKVQTFTTAEEAFAAAEKVVHEKYAIFLDNLKNKHGADFRKNKDYKGTFGVEVTELYIKYMKDSGLEMPKETEKVE